MGQLPIDTTQLLNMVIVKLDVSFWSVDVKTNRYQYISPNTSRIFGVSTDQLYADVDLWDKLIHPEDLEQTSVAKKELLSGKQVTARYRIIRPDGEIRWVEDKPTPYFDPEGELIWLFGMITDITEHKDIEQKLHEQNLNLTQLINTIPDCIFFKDGDGRWLLANNSALSLFQLEGIAYQGKTDLELAELNPNLKKELLFCYESDNAAWNTANTVRVEEVIPSSDGNQYFDVVKVPTFDEKGNRKGLLTIGRNITDRKTSEEIINKNAKELKESEQRFRRLIQNSSDVIMIIDEKYTIQFITENIQKIFGFKVEDFFNQNILQFIHPKDQSHVLKKIGHIMSSVPQQITFTFQTTHHNGMLKYVEAIGSNLINDPTINGIVFNCRDITEAKKNQEKIEYMAYHDFLTNLPNRRYVEKQLENTLLEETSPFALLFLDLDRFKNINDTYGHHVGDLLLNEVVKRLQSKLSNQDFLGRLSGDEFVIIKHDIDNLDSYAQQFVDLLNASFFIQDYELNVSVSIGISLFPQFNNKEVLLKNAEIAMYKAKELGKNNYQFYSDSLQETFIKKMVLENGLRKALEKNELFLTYQPKVTLDSHEMIGMEALIRWNHPEFGIVPPSEFIPLAEETGLIIPIGKWILETACIQLKKWQQIKPDLSVSVNVSGVQFREKSFVPSLIRVIESTNINPRYLELEITESVMQDFDELLIVLNKIKEIGVQVSIDDFGTGYSSLNLLNKLPIDSLKIDRTFVKDFREKNSLPLIKTIIDIGQHLNLNIVAEGIECENQLMFLKEINCKIGQGYYFSKPLTIQELELNYFKTLSNINNP